MIIQMLEDLKKTLTELLNHEKERNGHAQKHNHEKPCVQAFMVQHQQHNHHNQHERNAVKHPCSLRVR